MKFAMKLEKAEKPLRQDDRSLELEELNLRAAEPVQRVEGYTHIEANK